MKAAAVVDFITGNGAAARVKKFSAALSASDARLVRLNEQLEAAAEAFQETADVSALRSAEDAVAAEQTARAALVRGLESARKDLASEEAAKAARVEEERRARVRVEAARFGETITEKLVEVGRLLADHERLVNSLPSGERFRFWLPDYCEAASRSLCTDEDRARQGGTLQVDLQLLVPVAGKEKTK